MSYTFSLVTTIKPWHVTWKGTMSKDASADRRTTQSQKQQQIWAYPRNVNLLVLGQGNDPMRWLQQLNCERKERKIERYLKAAALWSLSMCCRLSDSSSLPGTNLLCLMKTLTLSFSSRTHYNLPTLSQLIALCPLPHLCLRHHVKSGVKKCLCGV